MFTKKEINHTRFIADGKYAGVSSHIQAYKLISNEIANNDFRNYKWFQKSYTQLKRLREKADYSTEFIKQEEVYEAFQTATSIISLINKI
ncbi:hypothetical protein SAMN05428949_5458 [Chitinophaga sp. YR627]|nr:hypothetical protein SAMN05428949_5458 [Chitinophaga sp. YR627]